MARARALLDRLTRSAAHQARIHNGRWGAKFGAGPLPLWFQRAGCESGASGHLSHGLLRSACHGMAKTFSLPKAHMLGVNDTEQFKETPNNITYNHMMYKVILEHTLLHATVI